MPRAPKKEKAEPVEKVERPKRNKPVKVVQFEEAKAKPAKAKAAKAEKPKADKVDGKKKAKAAKAKGTKKYKPSYGKIFSRIQSESKSRQGITVQAVIKYVKEHYETSPGFERHVRQAVRALEKTGYLKYVGVTRGLRLTDKGKTKFAKGKGKKKSSNAVSPYMQFVVKKRPEIVAENPNATFGEIGKLLGEAWKKLSDADKAVFVKKAKSAKKEKGEKKEKKEKKVRSRSASPKRKKDDKEKAKAKGKGKEKAEKEKAKPKEKPAAKPRKQKAEAEVEAEKPKAQKKRAARGAPDRGAPDRGADRGAPERGEEAEADEVQGPEVGKGNWEYFDNGWRPYDAAAIQTLEEAYAEYLKDPHAYNLKAVKSGDWEYRVDFKTMTQTNAQHQAHTSRKVRRV